MDGGLKTAEGPSPLCFLLRPPGGAGSVARTLARLLALSFTAAESDLQGHGPDSLEDESSAGALLLTLNSESWTDRPTDRLVSWMIVKKSFTDRFRSSAHSSKMSTQNGVKVQSR